MQQPTNPLDLCRSLFLADNRITSFPDLAPLHHLRTLQLARNRITSLGSQIVSSTSLCCLDLSHNRLTSVAQLQQLPHLRELCLSDNHLTSLEGLQVTLLLLLFLLLLLLLLRRAVALCSMIQVALATNSSRLPDQSTCYL